MLAGPTATTSRVRQHKEIPSNCSNIDREYHHQEHQHLATQSSKQSEHHQHQQQQKTKKSSRLLSSSISTSSEPPPQQLQLGSNSGSNANMNRRNKLSQQQTRFTTHINPMSPTTASSVSDVVTTNTSAMPPPLPMQDKTDIFPLHHLDQAHTSTSSSSTNIHTSANTTNFNTTPHIKSQLQNQSQSQQQQQHYQVLRDRHKENVIVTDKLDYATSSFTNVDDLTNAIRNKVIVEEDEDDILSSDNTFMY